MANFPAIYILHIDHIALKISKVTGILYRLKSIFPRYALLTLYNALIMHYATFSLLSFGLGFQC